MSARRVGEGKIELPPNPTWIDIPFSDGDPSTWPTNTTKVINSDGQVNFMEAQELNAYSALRWRIGVGKAIAAEMNMPEGPSYVLRQWPDNYRMFDHNKGVPDNPRHDIYLFGSTKAKKFRSVNEFTPHAIWLYRDYSRGGPPCQCKYCSKTKYQKEITATLSVYRSSPISSSPTSSTNKPRVIQDKAKPHELHTNRERQRDQKVYASVQKALRPVNPNSLPLNVPPHVLKQPMVAERNADLRAITAKTSMPLKRWFREGELVFCAVNPPIVGSSPDAVINVWPGIIKQTKLKSIPVPRNGNVPSDSGTTATALTNISNSTPSGVVLEHSSNEPSWSVQQSNMYKIQLLAVSHSYVAQDDQVIPYQAYNMPDQLLHALKEHGLHLDREQMKDFNPFPSVSAPPPNFADAISPFVVAMQIGTELSKFFSLLDEYDFQYEVQPPPRTPIPPPQSATSLQSAIEAAGRHNAQTGMASTSTFSEVIFPHATERRTQLRFQGMWWGAERIWADDFVRIKLARNAVAPNGNDEIYPPSGPGKSTIEYAVACGEDPSMSGAGSRGVFMRLEAFYIKDVRSPSGGQVQKEVRARGMLYELADIDWEEPEDQARKQPSSSSTAATQSDLPTVTVPPPSTFLPGLSPLKPPPLPNPDPSVPVSSASVSILANSPPTHPKPATSLHTLFPEAPPGYRFRQILPDDCEACVSLSLISGRYYPGILKHPMLKPIVEEAKSPSKDVRLGNYLWALEGLTAGFFNSVDAEYYRKSRVTMMDDADKNAMAILEGLLEQSRQREDSVMSDGHEPTASDDSMDVDS